MNLVDQGAARRAVERARVRERQRLAMDLHDTVAQVLFAIGVEAGLALEATNAAERDHSLRAVKRLTGDARAELYATLDRLNHAPPSPSSQSLRALLEDEVRAFAQATGVDAAFSCSGDVHAVGASEQELLIDTLGEALRNVRKHAMERARQSRVVVRLRCGDRDVELVVRNGGGTLPPADHAGPLGARGGLRLLRDRAEQRGGALEARRTAAGGGVVRLLLPVGATGSTD